MTEDRLSTQELRSLVAARRRIERLHADHPWLTIYRGRIIPMTYKYALALDQSFVTKEPLTEVQLLALLDPLVQRARMESVAASLAEFLAKHLEVRLKEET